MCGYCIETGAVLPFIESGTRHGQHNRVNHLQEGDNLVDEISRLDGFNDVPLFIDIVFCRLFEHHITQGFDASIVNQISATIGLDAVHSFLAKKCDEELRTYLGDEAIYRDEDSWKAFIGNKHILELSLATLDSYYDWWVIGNDKERCGSAQRMAATGIMDPIENTNLDDWNRFYNLFPLVSFSLSFAWQHAACR